MCGIAGILNFKGDRPVSRSALELMLGTISHRGPDESGIYMDDQVGLGHVRLSIIDLEGGTQPICNEDGALWIIYNGEAFNYKELRSGLLQAGHRFTTHTDTEVILHLYESVGPQCLELLNGQFALAIWDQRRRELFLARDRMGIRPLFYYADSNRFVFASEIKALLTDPRIARRIDPRALHQIFTLWSTITPDTVFENIHAVKPGHYLHLKQRQITEKPYWRLPMPVAEENSYSSATDAANALQALIQDAVSAQLIADVPVGAYLSGGLDSSIVAAMVARHYNPSLHTFSINFSDPAYDESIYQNILVAQLGLWHDACRIENNDIARWLPEVIWHCETPILRTAPVPLYLLARRVRQNGCKVVLTGEGADELFAGYNIFKEAKIRAFCARRPDSKYRPMLFGRLYPYIFQQPEKFRRLLPKIFEAADGDLLDPLFSHRVRWKNGLTLQRFFSKDMQSHLGDYNPAVDVLSRLPEDFASRDMLSRAQVLEIEIFLANYLLSSQGDRMALAHGIELRLPFLDHRLIDFAFKLPPTLKLRGLNEKYILKKTAERLLPPAIWQRTKQPYRAPIHAAFFSGPRLDYVEELLSTPNLKNSGYFDALKVEKLFNRHKTVGIANSNEIQNMAFMGILSTQLLHRQYIDQWPWKTPPPVKLTKEVDQRTVCQ